MRVTLGSATHNLRPDQIQAVQLGEENHPILAVQAAFGTGKTVIGALIAARHASSHKLVVATATTNAAVAQFADTLLRLSDYRHLRVPRFVSDSALMDGAPTTPADLHTILKLLSTHYHDQLRPSEVAQCESYTRGRELIETMIFDPERTLQLSEEEREEYRIAEREISDATDDAVAIMFRVRKPDIVCITTASLLNASGNGGIFHRYLDFCDLIVTDEASQIPEPPS